MDSDQLQVHKAASGRKVRSQYQDSGQGSRGEICYIIQNLLLPSAGHLYHGCTNSSNFKEDEKCQFILPAFNSEFAVSFELCWRPKVKGVEIATISGNDKELLFIKTLKPIKPFCLLAFNFITIRSKFGIRTTSRDNFAPAWLISALMFVMLAHDHTQECNLKLAFITIR